MGIREVSAESIWQSRVFAVEVRLGVQEKPSSILVLLCVVRISWWCWVVADVFKMLSQNGDIEHLDWLQGMQGDLTSRKMLALYGS
jgi:hypothetical protein